MLANLQINRLFIACILLLIIVTHELIKYGIIFIPQIVYDLLFFFHSRLKLIKFIFKHIQPLLPLLFLLHELFHHPAAPLLGLLQIAYLFFLSFHTKHQTTNEILHALILLTTITYPLKLQFIKSVLLRARLGSDLKLL